MKIYLIYIFIVISAIILAAGQSKRIVKENKLLKIYSSIKLKKFLVYVLKFKNKIGNPIGFDISLTKRFKKIKGEYGAKFMVKRLKNKTNFIKVNSSKVFKDFDLKKDFN